MARGFEYTKKACDLGHVQACDVLGGAFDGLRESSLVLLESNRRTTCLLA